MAVTIHCDTLSKCFGDIRAVGPIDWSVAAGACVGILGASGSGKSTLLRLIAGICIPSSGQVIFRGHDPEPDVTISSRVRKAHSTPRISMVFQSLALWPHLTARRHIQLSLGWIPRRMRRDKAEALLREVQLPHETWDRLPSQLSGGEGQRLALARALATEPDVLLLDEPLSHVDSMLREELIDQIRTVLARRSITTILVSHCWDDVAACCSRVVVLSQGHIIQDSPPLDIASHPATPLVARLTGAVSVVPTAWLKSGLVQCRSETPFATLGAPLEGEEILVRPHQLQVIAGGGQTGWTIIENHFQGAFWKCLLEHDGNQLLLHTFDPIRIGTTVGVEINFRSFSASGV